MTPRQRLRFVADLATARGITPEQWHHERHDELDREISGLTRAARRAELELADAHAELDDVRRYLATHPREVRFPQWAQSVLNRRGHRTWTSTCGRYAITRTDPHRFELRAYEPIGVRHLSTHTCRAHARHAATQHQTRTHGQPSDSS